MNVNGRRIPAALPAEDDRIHWTKVQDWTPRLFAKIPYRLLASSNGFRRRDRTGLPEAFWSPDRPPVCAVYSRQEGIRSFAAWEGHRTFSEKKYLAAGTVVGLASGLIIALFAVVNLFH